MNGGIVARIPANPASSWTTGIVPGGSASSVLSTFVSMSVRTPSNSSSDPEVATPLPSGYMGLHVVSCCA